MRSTLTPVGATGPGQWFPIDTVQSGFGVGYFCSVQQGSNLTYKIQHGFYDPAVDQMSVISIMRVTTTATLTFPIVVTPKVGDVVVIIGAGAPFDGTYDIASVIDASNITYTVLNSGLTTANAGAQALIIRTEDDPYTVNQTSSKSGNIAFPTNAIRLNVTAYTSGAVSLTVNQGIST
jgi:hypothetical protein